MRELLCVGFGVMLLQHFSRQLVGKRVTKNHKPQNPFMGEYSTKIFDLNVTGARRQQHSRSLADLDMLNLLQHPQ